MTEKMPLPSFFLSFQENCGEDNQVVKEFQNALFDF